MRTIAGIPSGPLDLEVSSWRRVWWTCSVDNLMSDIVNFEGRKFCGWNPWSFRLELEAKNVCIYVMNVYMYVCMYLGRYVCIYYDD